MPRKPDAPCAGGCGHLLWRSSTSGDSPKCRACRKRDCDWYRIRELGTCTECDRPALAKNLCPKHYSYVWRKSHKRKDLPRGVWISREDRMKIHERDHWACGLCGMQCEREFKYGSVTSPTLDHIMPRSLGGSDDMDNLTTAHWGCNARRQTRDFTEFVICLALENTPSTSAS